MADVISASFDHIISKAGQIRQPISGTFELTSRCNMKCGMCYVRSDMNNTKVKSTELSAQDWIKLAESASQSGMIFLLLTGGEIFARPDFFDIYIPLTQMGLQISIYTNATLITPSIAEKLAEYPPHDIEITIYGATEETYEKITDIKGSYRKFISGIDTLINAGLPSISLKSTITRFNHHEIDEMRKFAANRELPFRQGWILNQHQSEFNCKLDDFRLTPEEGTALEFANNSNDEPLTDDHAHADEKKEAESALFCSAGRSAFYITADGKMTPCGMMPQIFAKPLKIGFAEAWDEIYRQIQNIPKSKTCSAKSCKMFYKCAWCAAFAYLETGSYDKQIKYFCEIAKLRMMKHGAK